LTKKLLQIILDCLARTYIWRYEPMIIAVTGNVGKTSTKDAIACVMGDKYKYRKNEGNLNNEIGVPLTIIGDFSGRYYESGSGGFFWIEVILKGILGLIAHSYPEVLILEYGADKPGDIEKLANKFRPHIGVVTTVGDVPVHVEYFSGPDAVVKEKAKLVAGLQQNDFAILNYDDKGVLNMKEKTKAHVMTYGFEDNAKIKIADFNLDSNDQGQPLGVSFKLYSKESTFVPVKIGGSLGKSQAYAAGAAAGVGLALGMNLVAISNALGAYRGPAGRMKILRGINNSWIIDDTYNSSPSSAKLALDTLEALPARRKIAILGDMLELGKYTESAHKEIGEYIDDKVDILVCVGLRSKFISDLVGRVKKENKYVFETSDMAKSKVREIIRDGDLILVKGSQGIRMEKVVEEIMVDSSSTSFGGGEKKNELLVRQSKRWLNK
jgi:UDP-N-acetylmuramoyl-tripeptide--D-alanyl-D-alanine ligase